MATIAQALAGVKTAITGMDVTPALTRIWVNPTEASSISPASMPFAVISKMNDTAGTWATQSYGYAEHTYQIVVAIYLANGEVVPTKATKSNIEPMLLADQYYSEVAKALTSNMTLGGTVDYIGDGDGTLFDYFTGNILWDGKQYYGTLFFITVKQTVVGEFTS